jgi:SAM-dependent methyltransferase
MLSNTKNSKKQTIKTYSSNDELIPKYVNFPNSFTTGLLEPSSFRIEDEDFDARCPRNMRHLATMHWTRAAIARMATQYLVTSSDTKVLDIGSGVGKFCIVGAAFSNAFFTGVEQRKKLCDVANKIAGEYKLTNTQFIHANITSIDFSNYDAFYFYNSFHENMERTAAIDNSIPLEPSLYFLYSKYLAEQFDKLPVGTRLVTFWSDNQVPISYELLYSELYGALKFWRKFV